ncbi:hypothetical protein [Streptacidiphilus sp. EB103A]|uniref:hypothetical protein n=1 Tax=Streptacidiphilus sp. EB103A TaxID=3156275 RepID=UPI003514ABDA
MSHDIRAAARRTGRTEGELPVAARAANYLEAKLIYLAYPACLGGSCCAALSDVCQNRP